MLIEPHYLNVEGTKWEYVEVDRGTGKQLRKQFSVPRFLDPNDPADWTEKEMTPAGHVVNGRVIVSDGNGAQPGDIVFVGDPTPNMLPLDDEAKKISASYSTKWSAPNPDSNRTHSQSLLDDLEQQMLIVERRNAEAKSAPVEGIEKLLTAMAAMMEQNQQLLSVLGSAAVNRTGDSSAKSAGARRV
jgi:hypothetical protein